MKTAYYVAPPVADKALKSHDFLTDQGKPLPARAALGVWVALAAAGWAIIFGVAALVL